MNTPFSGDNATLRSIRVPAALRSVIIENDLAANDIALLLLIIERTMNVYPVKTSTALSIRHIAELNQCSPKGAENSVNKLKKLNLITHEVFPGTMRPGLMGLNFDAFGASAVEPEVRSPNPSAAATAESEAVTSRRRVEEEISAIRNMMFDAINSGKKRREEALPEPSLAALFLDHFGSPSAVDQHLGDLHADATKRKIRIRGYGYYKTVVNKLREAAVYERYVDSIPLTQQIELPAPPPFSRAGKKPDPRKPSFEDWQLADDDRADHEALLDAVLTEAAPSTKIDAGPPLS